VASTTSLERLLSKQRQLCPMPGFKESEELHLLWYPRKRGQLKKSDKLALSLGENVYPVRLLKQDSIYGQLTDHSMF
jgi:hypothetical protein